MLNTSTALLLPVNLRPPHWSAALPVAVSCASPADRACICCAKPPKSMGALPVGLFLMLVPLVVMAPPTLTLPCTDPFR